MEGSITSWISDLVNRNVNILTLEAQRRRGRIISVLSASLRLCGFISILLLGQSAIAQAPLSDLIFTVGTTAQSGGNNYSYVLVGSATPQLLYGKRFAVYGKDGLPSSGNSFALRGTMVQQSDATAINNLLNQSVALGQDLANLGDALNGLLRRVSGITNQPLAQKVLTAFQVANTNAATEALLQMFERTHPGLCLARGHAFMQQIPGVTTYEVREVHPITGAAGDVIGRVTLTPGALVILPAPGRPFHVESNSPAEDLTIKLRWGTSDELRRLSLLSYGFNVWRMDKALAETLGFHITPPTTAQLLGNPNFRRVNDAAVHSRKEFTSGTGAGAADDQADRITYFIADDNRRFETNSLAFTNHQQFYYFITARDLLGRDGLSSPGGLARACRRVAPQAPMRVAVHDQALVVTNGGATNTVQRFLISWEQNTNANQHATHYWIYRWANPSMALTNDATPLSNRVGVVTHVLGTNENSFLDNGAKSPNTPGLNVYWYTVRATDSDACDELLSPHSAPASGVLRQRDGPAAATGKVTGSCGTPAVMVMSQFTQPIANTEPRRFHYRFSIDRRDDGIVWVQFFVTNAPTGTTSVGPIYFAPGENRIDWDYFGPNINDSVSTIAAVVGTAQGRISKAAIRALAQPASDQQRTHVVFFSGTMLLTAPILGDPLLSAINTTYSSNYCLSAINPQPDPSGIVTMQFNLSPRVPVLVQGNTNGGNPSSWFEIGIALPDSNGTYAVSYPACVYGPLPQLRGCVFELPNDGDCIEHIARTGDDGKVAPILVEFTTTPRTREYRVYRQIDTGTPSLISQGATTYRPGFRIIIPDDTMPVTASRLCYYVQLLDEHGNPSPMALLGCKENIPKPPRPVLAEPRPLGTIAAPQVALNWFCPTAGVKRFRFLIKRVDEPVPGPAGSGLFSPSLRRSVSFAEASSTFRVRAVSSVRLLKNVSAAGSIQNVSFDEGQLTPTLDSGFGPGPQFTLTANVLPNVPYRISVQALNVRDQPGDVSEVWDFTWRPPPVVNNVPWPARPLPAVSAFDTVPLNPEPGYGSRVQAVLFTNRTDRQLLDYEFPVGIRIGELDRYRVEARGNIGTNRFAGYAAFEGSPADPHSYLFRRSAKESERSGQLPLPFVIYRQQVTNAAFPKVSGDLVQVSPLIDRLPWFTTGGNISPDVTIPDRLIAIGNVERYDVNALIYVRDQQPVTYRARYRYTLVRFQPNGEIDQIIPAGELQIDYFIYGICLDCE